MSRADGRTTAMPDAADAGLVTLSNRELRVAVSRLGAELASVSRNADGLELLWQGDEASWPRRAPWLFPIVGRLRDDCYRHGGVEFHLPQHGFARDRSFALIERQAAAATFRLTEDAATLGAYPFRFVLDVAYSLEGGTLRVEIAVVNPGREPLLFSLGGHPGFRCPIVAGERMSDYRIELERPETADRRLVVDGLIGTREPFLDHQTAFALAPELFARGALVLDGLRSERVRLVNPATGRGVELELPAFPYFAVWSKPPGAFVCLEPWCGLADGIGAACELARKEGIVSLAAGRRFARHLTIRPLAAD